MMSDDHNYFEDCECPTALSEETVLTSSSSSANATVTCDDTLRL